jgi:hypothetical protein
MHNCTRDGVGNQVLISSHRKLLSSRATAVNVAEKSGQDPDRQVERGERKREPLQKCREQCRGRLVHREHETEPQRSGGGSISHIEAEVIFWVDDVKTAG